MFQQQVEGSGEAPAVPVGPFHVQSVQQRLPLSFRKGQATFLLHFVLQHSEVCLNLHYYITLLILQY